MSTQVSFNTPLVSGDQSFDRVLNTGLPVAALFWSGPALAPGLEAELNERARADAGKLLVVRIKTDENPELTRRYNIRTTPTLITFKNGKEHARAKDVTPSFLRQHIEYLLERGERPVAPVRQPPPAEAPSPRTEAGARPINIGDNNFAEQVMQSPLPVIVDFWAPWCGPCRMVAPALEKIAADYAGRLRVTKMNVDENPRVPMQFQVQGIPTMLFVKNGRVVDRVVGALPEPRIRQQVERLLNS